MAGPVEIRFITRKWAPAVGGMETYSLRLTERLREERELEVISLPGRADGRAPSALSILGFGLATAGRLLASPPARVVHVADVASWPLAWLASLRHAGSRIVLSAHGSDLSYAKRDGWRPRLYAAYLSLGARCLSRARLIANSDWIAGLARDAGFGNVSTVHLATDLARSGETGAHNGALLFAGRITPSKGLSFLVEQVLPLLPNPPRLRVAGTVWDEEEAKVLSSPLVDYLGSLPPEKLAEEYESALCTLVPSLAPEGFGLTAVEAVACGGVVVAAGHSGLAEAVIPGSGFLADVAQPEEWAARIAEIMAWSADERSRFVARSQRQARERYDWGRVTRETLGVYEAD